MIRKIFVLSIFGIVLMDLGFSEIQVSGRSYGKEARKIFYTYKSRGEILMFQLADSPSLDKKYSRGLLQNMAKKGKDKRYKFSKTHFNKIWNGLKLLNLKKYRYSDYKKKVNPETHHIILYMKGDDYKGRKMYVIPRKSTPNKVKLWINDIFLTIK